MLANCKPNQSTKNKLKLNKHHSKIIQFWSLVIISFSIAVSNFK